MSQQVLNYEESKNKFEIPSLIMTKRDSSL